MYLIKAQPFFFFFREAGETLFGVLFLLTSFIGFPIIFDGSPLTHLL